MTLGTRSPSLEAALQPAGGTVSREQLEALGGWARPRDRGQTRAWALRVRELLAESPGRDLASAALQARAEVGASSSGTGGRRREAGPARVADGRAPNMPHSARKVG